MVLHHLHEISVIQIHSAIFPLTSTDWFAAVAVLSRPASRHDPSVPLIMGGTEAADGQFPWTLSIEYDGSLGWLHMCGGILVAPNYALTGAKCVNNMRVY